MGTTVVRSTFNQLQLPMLESVIKQEIVTVSNIYSHLQLKPVGKVQHSFNKELSLGTASEVSPIVPSGTWTASSPTFLTVTDTLKLFGDSAYVPRMAMNDAAQYAPIVAAKAKVIGRSIEKTLILGNGTDPEWTGLDTQVSGSQLIDIASAGSGSLTLDKLDTLISAVKSGPVSFLLMSTIEQNNLIKLMRGNYTQPIYITVDNFGSPVLTYRGYPIVVSDFITGATRKVFAVNSDMVTGTTLWYDNAADILGVREVPVNQSDLVEVQLTAKLGFSVMSSLSVAALQGING